MVTTSGLSTRGGFDLHAVGWSADPAALVEDLRARDLLPHLQGWQVVFSGVGDTAGAEPPLPAPVTSTIQLERRTDRAGEDPTPFDEPQRHPSSALLVAEGFVAERLGVTLDEAAAAMRAYAALAAASLDAVARDVIELHLSVDQVGPDGPERASRSPLEGSMSI